MTNCFLVESKSAVAVIEYIHDGNKEMSCAFDKHRKNEILLKIPRSLGATSAGFDVFSGTDGEYIESITEEIYSFENEYDIFWFSLDLTVGLYFIKPFISIF